MRTTIAVATGALLIAAAPAFAAKDKASLDLTVPLSLLSDADGTLTLTCDSAKDADARAMMRALQGRSSVSWESRQNDSRTIATRRGGKFRLRAWEAGAKKLDLKLPWDVAECVFGGRSGEAMEVDVDSMRGKGGLELLLAGEGAELGISLD